jgi:lysozyme family protein
MVGVTYEDAIARVLSHEGGYSNHPSDPGGPTNYGITISDYRRYVKAGATAADVRAMRLDEAKAIYRERYWNVMRCDDLPAGIDYAIFDYGVNSGVTRAIKVLQRRLGLADDGRMSDTVIAAARGEEASGLISGLCDERLAFLKRLKTWPVFGAGWGRRVAEVRAAALGMASRAAEKSAPAVSSTNTAARPVKTAVFRHGIASAIVVAGASAVQLAHQFGARTIIIAVIGAGILTAGTWFVWRRRRRRQQTSNIQGEIT